MLWNRCILLNNSCIDCINQMAYIVTKCPIKWARGGHSHWKGVWGCAAVMTPFFQTSHRSLAYQFTVNAPLWCPLFSIFRKFLHFQPCFGQNSSSLDPNFSKFSFLRPLFFKENPLPRPYILKPVWLTSTKKIVECPPPGKWATPFKIHTPPCGRSWKSVPQYSNASTSV